MDLRAGIALTDEHLALRDAVRGWAGRHCPPAVARADLDADAEVIPPFWSDLVAQGWIGLAVGEAAGGEGFGLAEAVVVIEELGRALLPGPFVPACLAATALDRFGGDALRPVVADLATGRRVGTVGIGPRPLVATTEPAGGFVVDGTWEAVLSAALADVLVLPVVPEGDAGLDGTDSPPECWVVVDATDVHVEPAPSLDRTRRVATVRADRLAVPAGRVVTCPPGAHGIRGLAAVVLAAEAVGLAAWCVDTAADLRRRARAVRPADRPVPGREAPVRRHALRPRAGPGGHVGRGPGGSDADAGRARRRGGGRPRARRGLRLRQGLHPGARRHRVHVGARRPPLPEAGGRKPPACSAVPDRGGRRWPPSRWRASAGTPASTCRPSAEVQRAEVRAFLDDLRTRPQPEWNRRIADSGYLVPHWPAPWGRDAGPLEQLVDRRGVRPGPRPPPAPGRRGVGAADHHRPRHRRPAGAVGRAHAAGRADVVPDVQRARRRLRPGLGGHQGGAGRRRLAADRPEGVDVDGGPRRPRASASPAPTRRRRGTRASAASSSTCGPKASTCARCAS